MDSVQVCIVCMLFTAYFCVHNTEYILGKDHAFSYVFKIEESLLILFFHAGTSYLLLVYFLNCVAHLFFKLPLLVVTDIWYPFM